MNSQEFCYWLQGFMEIAKPETVDETQLQEIKNHLDLAMGKTREPVFIDDSKTDILSGESPTYCAANPSSMPVVAPTGAPTTITEVASDGKRIVSVWYGGVKVSEVVSCSVMDCGCSGHPTMEKNDVTKQLLHTDKCSLKNLKPSTIELTGIYGKMQSFQISHTGCTCQESTKAGKWSCPMHWKNIYEGLFYTGVKDIIVTGICTCDGKGSYCFDHNPIMGSC